MHASPPDAPAPGPLADALAAFFDDFVQAFGSFDGARVARRYAAPYTALQADGRIEGFDTPAAIAAYFQRVLDDYRGRGCTHCRWHALQASPLGRRAALASVRWTLHRADGSLLADWRESYALARASDGGALRIFSSIDHAD